MAGSRVAKGTVPGTPIKDVGSMFLSEEDETDAYRDCLAGLSDRFPYCRYILEKFDADDHPPKW